MYYTLLNVKCQVNFLGMEEGINHEGAKVKRGKGAEGQRGKGAGVQRTEGRRQRN